MTVSHNQKIKQCILDMHVAAKQAQNVDDLVEVVGIVEALGCPLEFNNRLPMISLGSSVIAGSAILLYSHFLAPSFSPLAISLIVVCVICLILATAVILLRKTSVTNLAKEIFRKNVLFDNDLFPSSISNKQQMSILNNRFCEFSRGNHTNEIKEVLDGRHEGAEHNFNYQYYHYHWVNKRIETTVVSDGKGGTNVQTRTVYDHFDRYGFYLDFPYAKNIAVISSTTNLRKTARFKPSSNRFNKRFSVYYTGSRPEQEGEFLLAKMMKPAVVVAFEDIADLLSGLNCEFNSQGELCMSFSDNVISYSQQYNLEQPAQFVQELKSLTKLYKLKSAMAFVTQISRHLDQN